jgi:hypothetical protein
MQIDEVEEGMHASPDSFAAILEPLERATGQRLNGSARTLCMQAFEECAEGFRLCATKALRRAHSNPVGLLVKMVVKDGEHRRAGRSLAPDAPPTPLERWLGWAQRTAPLVAPEDREEILQEADLSSDEREQVRQAIARSLEPAEQAA